jgi:hypothetical protein
MNIRSKNILVFCFMLLVAIAIYIWFYPLNKGSLSISSNVDAYYVSADDINFECTANPCQLSLKTGFYNIKIQKDKYLPEAVAVNIIRGNTSDISIALKKNPILSISKIVPPSDNKVQNTLPKIIEDISYAAAEWNSAGDMLVFLDRTENKLNIWTEKGGIKTITSLKNISDNFKLYWSPDSKYLLGAEKNDIYFIDIEKASRKKISIGFVPINIKWSQKSEYLLANDDENGLYKIDFVKKSAEPIVIILPLANAVWEKEDRLIFFLYDTDTYKTAIKSFDLISGQSIEILTKDNFLADKISSDTEGNIYLYDSEGKTWYVLDY